jgi:hypothetical protein
MTLPPAFQKSYRERLVYPESLIPSSTAIYSSKLKSYRSRLDDAEKDLCLLSGKDDVESIFEIPIIDLATDDGKGWHPRFSRTCQSLINDSVASAEYSYACEAYQMARHRNSRRSKRPKLYDGGR